VGDAKLLVDLHLGKVAMEDGMIIVSGIEPAAALATGKPRWFRVMARYKYPVLDGDCGKQGTEYACEITGGQIVHGQACQCSRFVYDVRGEEA
jgi:hypothetical protein